LSPAEGRTGDRIVPQPGQKNQSQNSSIRHFSKAMMTSWGDTTEEDETSREEEATVALMAKSESYLDNEPVDSLSQLMEKVMWS